MTDTKESGKLEKLTNGALKKYAIENLPHIPEEHTGPLQAAELADVVISWGGTGHNKQLKVLVVGYKNSYGMSLGIVGEGHRDPETNVVDKAYFEWISHFESYTPLEKYGGK
jgi:hypothetical protein